jgi:cyclase
MQRTHFHSSLPLAFIGLAILAAVFGRDPEPQEFKVHAVNGTVSYLEGAGGNIGLCVGDDGLFVIDDQLARFGGDVESTIKTFSDKPVSFLLNTHWHGDHTGNNVLIAKGAPIIAHSNVRRRLAADAEIEGRKNDPPMAAAGLPVLTYEQSITLHLNGEEILVLHFPNGHTDGDSIVLFTESNVVHMGDLFFSGRFPFIDLNSGGSVEGYTAAVGAILAALPEGAKIIPGHGPLSSAKELRAFHEMLLETARRVRAALAEGKDAGAMKADGLLDDYAETWGGGFIDSHKFIDTLAQDLAGGDSDHED